MRDMVLVLNFDDAASRAVTRRLRSERVMCKIVPGSISLEEILAQEPLGLLLASGVAGKIPSGLDERILPARIPLLALGDASAMLLNMLGGAAGDVALQGAVTRLDYRDNPLLKNLESGERLLQCAREFRLSASLVPICGAQEITIGFAHAVYPLWGLQFQVESNDPEGMAILKNFALDICGCTTWWDDDAFVSRAVEEIGRVVGSGRAACAMTGGLDSGVSALLAFKALGKNLRCIFVDTGLLREHESDDFMAYYRDEMGMDILRIEARERFLSALRGVRSTEEKKRVIGDTIQQILLEKQSELGPFDVLIRGTSYNDIMFGIRDRRPVLGENVPAIEPVRELFKDEIRRIADFMGIPSGIISRQPFPGSGLALRIMGEVTEKRLSTLRAADAVFRRELERAGAAKRLWQYFAVLSPLPEDEEKSVVCLRAVHASERSQAYAARLPYDVMETVMDLILRDLKDVRRVVYDLTPSSNYAGIEWP